MKYPDFKRLALTDPNCDDADFIEYSKTNPSASSYLNEVRKMDADLSASLDVDIPDDLVAKLKLHQELTQESQNKSLFQRYSIAASLVVVAIITVFTLNNQHVTQVGEDYQSLISGVIEHMNEKPFTPVWENARANQTVSSLLSSYDNELKMKEIPNLTFGRICPMGHYRGLHATLETQDGPVTFAYIKGEPVGDIIDTSYDGYMARVKPLANGNLVIISKNTKSLKQTDQQLKDALYWNI